MDINTGIILGSALTDIGLRRAVNEDSVLSARSIFAVADGMGGHEAGDLASQLCIQTMAQLAVDITVDGAPLLPHAQEVLAQVERADAAIRLATGARGGTTLCALALVSAEPGGGTWPAGERPPATTLSLPVQPAPAAPAAQATTRQQELAARYLETTHEAHLGGETPAPHPAATPLPVVGNDADPTTDVLPYIPAPSSPAPLNPVLATPVPFTSGAVPGSAHRNPQPPAGDQDPHAGQPLQLMLLNVGDSRGYRLRAGKLTQLTLDHSAVQELIDAGTITEAEARVHPQRNLITRALGAGGNSVPDAQFHALVQGDRYLLCSDGLTGEVEHAGIERILNEYPDRTTALAKLVDAALASGGRDNISVLIVDIEAPGTGSPSHK